MSFYCFSEGSLERSILDLHIIINSVITRADKADDTDKE